MRKTEEAQNRSIYSRAKDVLISAAFGLAMCLALLAVFSAAVLSGAIDEGAMYGVVVACCFVSVLFGSVMAAGKNKSMTLLVGLAVAAIFFLALLLVGAVFYDAGIMNGGIGIIIACVLGGLIGSVFSARKKKRRK